MGAMAMVRVMIMVMAMCLFTAEKIGKGFEEGEIVCAGKEEDPAPTFPAAAAGGLPELAEPEF